MTISIPIAIEHHPKDCQAELLTLDGQPIVEMFRGYLPPGIHSIDYDPESAPEGIEAGLYILRLIVDGHVETWPIQYMP